MGVAVAAALAGFRSVAATTSLTAFWEAIEYTALSGVGTLLVAGVALPALPRLVGREIHTKSRVKSLNRFVVIGSVGVLVFLSAAGVLSGYSWIGGSNSGTYVDAGEGWAAGVGASVDTLMLIAIGFAFVTFLGQMAYTSTVFGTLTRGKATEQEVLVAKGSYGE